MMINKYIELHKEFIDLLAEYHNAHLRFIRRPNYYNSESITKVMKRLKKLVAEMRRNCTITRTKMLEEKRQRIVERRKIKERKKNENTNIDINTNADINSGTNNN